MRELLVSDDFHAQENNHAKGVLQAVNKKGNGAIFSKDDEMLLGILSNLAGVVLRNSMSYNEQLSLHNVLRTALKVRFRNSLILIQIRLA